MMVKDIFRIDRFTVPLLVLVFSLLLVGSAVADLLAQQMPLNFAGAALELHADPSGNLWISDYLAGEIWKVSSSGTAYTRFNVKSLVAGPGDAQPDADGNIWFVDDTYLRKLDPLSLTLQSWDFKTTAPLYGLGFDTSGDLWLTEPGSFMLYNVNVSEIKYAAYLVPNSADFLYPLVSGTQLWLGDSSNNRLLRLDFSSTPEWTYWTLPACNNPYYLALDASNNLWYSDNVNGCLGRLSPASSQLTVYNLPAGTAPYMLSISGGFVWYGEQGLPSIGSLDPALNSAIPQEVDTGTIPASPTLKNVPTLLDDPDATKMDGISAWSPSVTYLTQYEGDGWWINKLPDSSQPTGIAISDYGYLLDSMNQVLIRFSPDATPTLRVIKHVINDNGGTAVAADFTMHITASNPSQVSFPSAESPGTSLTLDPGSYSISETGPAGYVASYSAECTGTIALGRIKTCTITNDDIAPTLTLVKSLINDDGGTGTADQWALAAVGMGGFSNYGICINEACLTANLGPYAVRANEAYTLLESAGPGNYASGSWICDGGTQDGSSVTLAVGQNVTCTITNDDIPPQIKIYLPLIRK